jgi:hypothetical protein
MKPKIASTKTHGTKTKGKKLQLAKETLRSLSGTELSQVAGGSANQVFTGAACPVAGESNGAVLCNDPGTGISDRFSSIISRCGSIGIFTGGVFDPTP